ncbi:MAG: hypothetical protein V3R20_03810 [Sphingomonadales bacterium]
MKAPLKYISLAALAAFVAFPAQAEDSPRFSAEDFLKEWNVFLDEETKSSETDKVKSDFIFFNTDSLPANAINLNGQNEKQNPFTPRKSSLSSSLENIVLPGETWLLNTFTPRFAGAVVSFGIGSGGLDLEATSKVDISFTSQISSRQVNVFGAVNNAYILEAVNRQVYDVGLNVGYANFNLGASLRGEEGAYYDGISGYDVGLSYNRPRWSTSILLGEYRQVNNRLLGLNSGFYDERFFALEFGAAYNLAPWFKFVGSFRFYEDANRLLMNPNGITTSQMFYLGTKLKF